MLVRAFGRYKIGLVKICPGEYVVHVGVCRIVIRLHGSDSLKYKRNVSRSICDRVRKRFNVSIAEVESNDLWEILVLGIGCVSNDARHASRVLSKIVDYIDLVRGDTEVIDCVIDDAFSMS